MRSLTFEASACDGGVGTANPPQRRNPTTVTNDTNKTIATVEAANCGSDSSQVRPINRLKNDGCDSAATTLVGSSASITFRMRSQSASVFGGASYWPR